MTEFKILLPAIVLLVLGDYIISTDLDFFEYKYFVLLHFFLVFWSIVITLSYKLFIKKKPSFGGLIITAGLLMKMISGAVIFYLLHTKFLLSNLQVINFMSMYFLYTFILIYSLSTSLSKNMIKNT